MREYEDDKLYKFISYLSANISIGVIHVGLWAIICTLSTAYGSDLLELILKWVLDSKQPTLDEIVLAFATIPAFYLALQLSKGTRLMMRRVRINIIADKINAENNQEKY